MGLLDLAGKRGLVVGIANASSIAYGCAKAFHAAGAELEEDVRVPGHRGRNRLDLRHLLRDAIVERQGPV